MRAGIARDLLEITEQNAEQLPVAVERRRSMMGSSLTILELSNRIATREFDLGPRTTYSDRRCQRVKQVVLESPRQAQTS